MLSHREFEPAVEGARRTASGSSSPTCRCTATPRTARATRTRSSGTRRSWPRFCRDTCGPRPLVGGHGAGRGDPAARRRAGLLQPSRLVIMPNRLHRPPARDPWAGAGRAVSRAAALPGFDRGLARAARLVVRPERGMKLTARGNPAARDLVRHAMADVGENPNLARSWSRFARRWPRGAQRALLDAYPKIRCPVLLLWADEDLQHPVAGAEEALDLLPDGMLRVLSGTGYLIAYDDPVGVARELVAFCG